jgi:hypothetical protein
MKASLAGGAGVRRVGGKGAMPLPAIIAGNLLPFGALAPAGPVPAPCSEGLLHQPRRHPRPKR